MDKLLYFALVFLSLCSVSYGQSSQQSTSSKLRCKEKQKYFGCMYFKSFDQCFCTTRRACEDPFKFKSKRLCMSNVLKQAGACKRHPCMNQAKCTPIKKHSKFLCDCTGTGFYGKRCHKVCPKVSDLTMDWLQQFITHRSWKNTPIACITKG